MFLCQSVWPAPRLTAPPRAKKTNLSYPNLIYTTCQSELIYLWVIEAINAAKRNKPPFAKATLVGPGGGPEQYS